MANSTTGGCLCGELRYELGSPTDRIIQCHCRNCQKISGAGASTNILIDTDQLVFTKGEPKIYVDTAASGNKLNRGFCANCGSSLFSQRHNMMNKMVLKAGSLDETPDSRIVMNIWTHSARPWVEIDTDVESHEQNRPV